MTSWFRSKRYCKLVLAATALLTGGVLLFWVWVGDVWTLPDYQAIDRLYRTAVSHGKGPLLSDRIVYLTITDETYRYFKNNNLDRNFLADVNHVLARFDVAAVAYDLIFARPSKPAADRRFADSIQALGMSYLPIGFQMEDQPAPFRWEAGAAFERLRTDFSGTPVFQGRGTPFYGSRSLMQLDDFAAAGYGAGHISVRSDADGVYRHAPMLLQIDRQYIPTLSLAMFLDAHRISLESVHVHWGRQIRIPATAGEDAQADVTIPIDSRGRVYVPFPADWNRDFKKMEAHALLEYAQDPSLEGNLSEFFEGRFVFVADVSSGVSDLGTTSLESDAPLVSLHAALLNGMLTNRFFKPWNRERVFGIFIFFGCLLGGAALFRSNAFLYAVAFGGGCLIAGGAWHQLLRWQLVPIAAIFGSYIFVFGGLVISLQIAVAKERRFIKTAFSRYIPRKVVTQILENPELLQLGGEEREVTVLFSDLVDFTKISEQMAPSELVRQLNAYLTEMTEIVMQEGGIIDKYLGDAIMAEFGIPLTLPDHADRAVRAGLDMHKQLRLLQRQWRQAGLPALHCRIGINTGVMVAGNMGSSQVFDYTVIGDPVNLASRLEGVNKFYGTNLMISEFTRKRLTPDAFQIRLLDVVKVKGKSQAIRVYEVYGEKDAPIDAADRSYFAAYESAVNAYLNRNADEAKKKFNDALTLRPRDPAAQMLLNRVRRLDFGSLPEDWDGAVVFEEK